MPEFSRSRLQGLIRAGRVQVDGVPATKSGQRLEGAGWVEVVIPPTAPADLQAEDIPLDILYEDSNVIVVNKPAGMVVHPSAGHTAGTLAHAVLGHAPELEGVGGERRPGVVHRLDKDTSGVIILAKSDAAHQLLQAQFKDRKAEKIYLALVDGHPPTPTGRVDAPIGRDPANRKRMAVMPPGKGRTAISEFRTLEEFPEHTLLEVTLLTGRTHQIRAHMAFVGTPVAGDRVYGLRKPSLPLKRQFLHAWRLGLALPGEANLRRFEAPLAPELAAILDSLRG
ncbi:MAG: RluA family pseudouridine synthase [Chloroflexi bacterium]|nr:RluA family pseudouridine synthase [Chloroflexota bacterium]